MMGYLLLLSVGWHRGLGDAARGCLRAACGCHEVYAAMMEQPVGATAVRAAVRTIMQRWNRGIEPDVAIQVIVAPRTSLLARLLVLHRH